MGAAQCCDRAVDTIKASSFERGPCFIANLYHTEQVEAEEEAVVLPAKNLRSGPYSSNTHFEPEIFKTWIVRLEKSDESKKYGIVQSLCMDGSNHLQGRCLGEVISCSGLADRYNRNCVNPEDRILPWDRIASVNGVSGVMGSMREQLKQCSVALKMVRFPREFSLTLERGSVTDKYGFSQVPLNNGSSSILIRNVEEDGVVHLHNIQAIAMGNFHLMIHPGFLILAVNAVSGDYDKMMEELNKSLKVTLFVAIPAEDKLGKQGLAGSRT